METGEHPWTTNFRIYIRCIEIKYDYLYTGVYNWEIRCSIDINSITTPTVYESNRILSLNQ